MKKTLIPILCIVTLMLSGCAESRIYPSEKSKIKSALDISEWVVASSDIADLEIIACVDGEERSVLKSEAPLRVSAIYLQKMIDREAYLLCVESDRGTYKTMINSPFGVQPPKIHDTPVRHEDYLVLMNKSDGLVGTDGVMTHFLAVRLHDAGSNKSLDLTPPAAARLTE
jgi:hypothetical protein